MITNTSVTIYHKSFDATERTEKWTRYNYDNAWFFGGRNANVNEGYDNTNNVEIRLPYSKNNNLDINNFAIGDIIVSGTLTKEINAQQDLSNYLIYNIISIKDNKFGSKHIHLGGK